MDLLNSWAAWQSRSAPFVLDADRPELLSSAAANRVTVIGGWPDAHQSPRFLAPGDTRLHLGLLPIPFAGDVRNATIYVLLLNPGLSPHDYYGEYEVPEFRNAMLANLRQGSNDEAVAFPYLDTRFAWHAGFGWWHGKLCAVIERLAVAWQVSFAEARTRLAARIACIELVPYHSATFADGGRRLRRLPSAELARRFVQDFVLERVRQGKAIAIATRQAAEWNLPTDQPGIVTYSASEARAAHLTPGSSGGRAILEHLGVGGA